MFTALDLLTSIIAAQRHKHEIDKWHMRAPALGQMALCRWSF